MIAYRKQFRRILALLTTTFLVVVSCWYVRVRVVSAPVVASFIPEISPTTTFTYPNTYHDVLPFMTGFYAAAHTVTTSTRSSPIRALIIPHHLLATEAIATGVKSLQGQSFTKIVLLSPDHFDRCEKTLCTTSGSYQTFFGVVHPDTLTLKTLQTSPLVAENTELFKTEHGIFADLPYLASYFPNIPVTPLVLSSRPLWRDQRADLLSLFEEIIDTQTILIVSSDFSHYLPEQTANTFDAQTEQVLRAKDLAAIASLRNPDQSDCPGCLWILTALAAKRQFYTPTFLSHTNSATLLHEPTLPITTSHYAISWSDEPPQNPGK